MNMKHVLRVNNLTKTYHGKRIVDNLSLSVQSGEIVGLLGPNGAGKTTTFYMIIGIINPEKGKVYLDDEDITSQPMYIRARKGLNYLPQEASVFRKMSVEENILAILETLGISPEQMKEKLQSLLKELCLEPLAKNRASTLSGGERRRLEITRALVTSPIFMILDEPFAGIDPIAVSEIKEIVCRLKSQNIGILISDHNVRETLRICDRAYILNKGKILEAGTPLEIANSALAKEFYLGADFTL
ncbi:ABC transporter ATP-binding protein [Candidatus Desulfofervidus auxilii]|uniref:ABC transporter ATP-binding protein n=2 Tax=Desulfofervidus auxilii TaxID=1621989 RepID=A0A7U4TJ87_DESA2|nr:ABC transporter ATP-binding protein [Candidatus Desulfofervidus auxilii]CAD7776289.1 MAG: Lipopolysaccharide export system ATP-binding protein LptB [Candidatus Methanoperedenaceae archaeon GB50]CAD7781523.1 Lipopolysaccharide export system ATP-binding protein LptB [Candidatus Methanoperedenaceae archaeon GB50]CAD7782383.1 Lipopolysaccharide export system ATP-binding protein LptB [Candidatus Methanoperedenaceae archaeon GB37]